MQITQKLAAFAAETRYENIPQKAIDQAKAGILDWIFVAMAGQVQSSGAVRNFTEMVQEKGGHPESTLIGVKTKVTENQAAVVNGVIGHILDYDETCPKVRSHLFAAILPAVLAAAEHRKLSGKDLLTAFLVGHEVAMRAGEAITPKWIKAGWHGTSLFGIFGAAAGCCKLLKAPVEKIRSALGIAASMASGVAANFGSLTKPFHAGMAAERGLMAAQMAFSGFTANPAALEGALGFYHAYNWGEAAQSTVFDMLGNPWGLETPGISSIKLYPCCHGLATNIEYGIRIHNQYRVKLEEIESIELHSQPKTLCAMLSREYEDTGQGLEWGYDGPPRQMKTILPSTAVQAKFSKEYAFSRALKDGEMRLAHFTDEAVNEPEIRKWMEKIKLFHNSTMEKYANQYPEETAPHAERMVIHLKDGQVIEQEEIFILGMTKRPLTFKDVEFKYYDCGSVAGLSETRVADMISLFNRLETVSDISEMMKRIGDHKSE